MKLNKLRAGLLVFCIFLFLSCQNDYEFIGYNDLIVDSPTLLWGSSIEEVKSKYPNIKEAEDTSFPFWEEELNGQIKNRGFQFFDNKLSMVLVSYGNYTDAMLDSLKEKLTKQYGGIKIEDNGTIATWYIVMSEENKIVMVVNKLENNTVNCSYIHPPFIQSIFHPTSTSP